MIIVKKIASSTWTLRMDIPDQCKVSAIAVAFSIPVDHAIVAIMNRGIDSIDKQLKAEADKVTKKRQSEESDCGGD